MIPVLHELHCNIKVSVIPNDSLQVMPGFITGIGQKLLSETKLEFSFYKVDSLFTLERKKLLGQKEDDLGMRTLYFVLNTLDG